MFTPIKNLITYIQKNANFGSNTTATEETAKMETSDQLKLQTESIEEDSTSTSQVEKATACEEKSTNETTKDPPTDKKDSQSTRTATTSSPAASKSTPLRSSPRKIAAVPTTCVFDLDDDIEAQIESSIMLKKPVKDATSKGTEILEVKKSPDRSIFISHDYNRNHAATPIEDELEDFRHDPTEVVTSSPLNHATTMADDCSVDSAEEARDVSGDNTAECCDHINLEEEECEEKDKDKTKDSEIILDLCESEKAEESVEKIILLDSEMEDDIEDIGDIGEVHSLSSVSAEEEEDDVEETFLDMDTFPDSEVIVISENIPENCPTLAIEDSIDAANTSDDPLAIACDEQEAFAADKINRLEELNLLSTNANSQDEEDTATTTTTTEDDLLWLRADATQRNEQPSCSKSPAKIQNESGSTPEKDERNGEGSDSGLGSETSALHTTNTSLADTSQLNMTSSVATHSQSPSGKMRKNAEKDRELVQSPLKEPPKPLRSNLKRRLEVDDDVVDSLRNITSAASTSTTTTTSSLSDNHNALSGSLHKKPKRSINFDNVQVYYFPRQQGFSCVPSAGGCTLGMGARHVGFKTLTLAEHAAELRRAHRMQLQEINPRGSSSDDSEESEEDYLSEGSGSDLDGESNGFLQPVSPKQRRTILKAAGIRKIDASEKAECRDIRNSREVCGCSCRDFCDPETCACSQSGIKCQVDRDMFPCGCSRDACGNTIGRVEFNPARVRTHFIHTLMRLEMENRQQQNPYSPAVVPTATATASSYYQSHLQPPSNYSSGYASPAYNASAEMHQQTAANTFYHQQTPSSATSLYGQPATIELPLNGSSAPTSSVVAAATPYGGMVDSLDSALFGGAGAGVTPSYGELMPVSSYHHHNINFGNVQTQVPGYNSYHNSASFMNANATATLNNAPTSYSSCAVPSIPPYGTATTTEATGVYHSVDSLMTLETTTAPSCTKTATTTTTLDSDIGTSFISLSTPLASSSRLSQINDLLQHNRNATTALVAVTQTIGSTASAPVACSTVAHMNGSGGAGAGSGTYNTTSINTPPIEDAHKSCMAYVDLTAPPPLKPAPIVAVVVNDRGPEKLPAPPPLQPSLSSLTSEMSLSSTPTIRTTTTAPMIDLTTPPTTPLNAECLPQPHDGKDTAAATTSTTSTTSAAPVSTAEVTAMEVVVGN